MPRGTALSELRAMFKAECGLELSESITVADDANFNRRLRMAQQWLVGQGGFLLGKGRAEISLTAGTRFYDFPETELDIDRVTPDVFVKMGDEPLRRCVHFGIGQEQYQVWDSELSPPQKLDWVRRWDLVQTASDGLQVEVWPVPETSTQTLEFTGIKPLATFTQDTDLADLDDLLIVLWAAAKFKAKRGDSDAQATLSQAQAHLSQLKGNRQSGFERFNMAGGGLKPRPKRVVVGVSNV